ncbi:prepilin-type N-terminal cleavage/methylation domain-containing protein [Patescibacteria group bacterium]|nr:prepilin-type N-terminal cleavage/methylation domain-containing protein [Patescibacteria group bacterium]
MEQYIKNNKGQILIELIIAVAIISIILSSTLIATHSILQSSTVSKQKLEAKYLLQQQIESMYAIVNSSWANLLPGEYHVYYNPTNNPPTETQGWKLGVDTMAYNEYTEYITISNVYRVNSNQVTSNSTYPYDPNTKEVTATVTFKSFGNNYTYNESIYFTNWQQY